MQCLCIGRDGNNDNTDDEVSGKQVNSQTSSGSIIIWTEKKQTNSRTVVGLHHLCFSMNER